MRCRYSGPHPFLVVNSDVWTDLDFSRVPTLEEGADARLLLAPNPPHHPRGDFGLEGDLVVERAAGRFTYTGIGVYRPELFAGCAPGKFPLLPLLQRAIAARRAAGRGLSRESGWTSARRSAWRGSMRESARRETLERPTGAGGVK